MTTQKKTRKEKLSIYLVRDKTKPNSQIIKIENAKPPIDLDIPDIDSASLYVKKPQSKNTLPSWTKLFTTNGKVDDSIFGQSSNVGAVLIVKAYDNIFILSFGTGFHLLKPEAIERDFGLRVTLNSVDPDKLRSLDKASYDHNPLNSRTQSTKDVDIFNLHLDSEMEMLYAVTGTSLVDKFGTQVTGRDALTIAVDTNLNKIPDILKESINRYQDNLPSKFSWVDNINRVKDYDEIEKLDLELDKLFESKNFDEFWLGEPEVVDWENQLGYSFDLRPKTPRHTLLSFKAFLDHLNGATPTVALLKSNIVHANNNEYKSVKSWPVYRCLYAEIDVNAEHHILRNGIWYKVNTDFVKAVDEYLKDIDIHHFEFPTYSHEREDDYNQYICDLEKSFCLMDKNNIRIGGAYDKLEHCDLIKDGREFIHIKRYRSSSTLSHLFSQGFVAAEAFIKDSWYREQLNPKLPKSIQLEEPKARPNPNDYTVVYAIATKKTIPQSLPFFSKVTLKNSLKTLRALDYKIALAKIDIDPSLIAKKKYKPKKAKK